MGDNDFTDLVARVESLERALAQLASRSATAPQATDGRADQPDAAGGAASQPGDGGIADRFWALEGLKARSDEPGAVLFTGTVWVGAGEHYEWQETRLAAALLDQDWGELAANLSALAHPVRLALLQEVVRGQTSVSALAQDERFGTSGQLYHHLRQLVSAGWLTQSRRGHYGVPPARVIPLLALIMGADR